MSACVEFTSVYMSSSTKCVFYRQPVSLSRTCGPQN